MTDWRLFSCEPKRRFVHKNDRFLRMNDRFVISLCTRQQAIQEKANLLKKPKRKKSVCHQVEREGLLELDGVREQMLTGKSEIKSFGRVGVNWGLDGTDARRAIGTETKVTESRNKREGTRQEIGGNDLETWARRKGGELP